jgi:hypothetical protein
VSLIRGGMMMPILVEITGWTVEISSIQLKSGEKNNTAKRYMLLRKQSKNSN